jgi:hypothetical protein
MRRLLALVPGHDIPRAELTKSMLKVRLSNQVSSTVQQTLTHAKHLRQDFIDAVDITVEEHRISIEPGGWKSARAPL